MDHLAGETNWGKIKAVGHDGKLCGHLGYSSFIRLIKRWILISRKLQEHWENASHVSKIPSLLGDRWFRKSWGLSHRSFASSSLRGYENG